MNRPLVAELAWDSVFFERSISSLDVEQLAAKRDQPVDLSTNGLIQAKVPVTDVATVELVQCMGFHFVEGEIVYEKALGGERSHESSLRLADSHDIPAVVALARSAFEHSRFREPWFRPDDASRLYGEWARKAVLSAHDDLCLIDEEAPGSLSGLVTAKIETDGSQARIGLICVAARRRGAGVANRLLGGIEEWATSKGALRMLVATQSSNLAASRLYLRNGYLPVFASYWFYR